MIQVTVFSQDIIVTNYTGPTTFSQYEEITMDFTVKNTGIVSTNGYFYVAAYLSTDAQLQTSDKSIPSYTSLTLGAGQSSTVRPNVGLLDIAPGTYYLIIKGDYTSTITETDESNNLLVIPNIVITQPNVDFTLTTFSLDKATYTQNSLIKPSYVLQNLGSTNVGSFLYIQFALSTDAIFSQNDKLIGYGAATLTGVDVVSSPSNLGLALPTVPNGSYYILAWVDDNDGTIQRFVETNETNNIFSIPIAVQSSNTDLVITNTLGTSHDSNRLMTVLSIRNNGSTGVAGFTVGARLTPGGNSYQAAYLNSTDSYIGPYETKSFHLDFPNVYEITPGTYYAEFNVNFDNAVLESDTYNNTYIDPNAIYISPPPTPGVTLNSSAIAGVVDDTDQQISLNLNLTNSGNTTSFYQYYTIKIKNAQNVELHSQQESIWINFLPSQTVNRAVTLNLSSPLPAGSYQVSISCTNSCHTTPSLVNTTLTVSPTEFTVTGSVQGEDGQPITKGKLFLYQDNGSGTVRFIQKVVPYLGPDFSFAVDPNPHTLYFIPDPVEYPDYVPTIYGKTLTLQPSNFFSPSANMNVTFEVLKVDALGTGTGVINGVVSSGNPSGRVGQTEPLTITTADIPVILISSTGEIAGITYTDASGFYEFKDLVRGSYQIMLCFELDNPLVSNPFTTDITDKNMQVNIQVSEDGIYPTASQLYFSQVITFSELAKYKYGDPAITLSAQSNIGLPIDYVSSNEEIATVIDGEIIIKSVGTVIITAKQVGNTFYLPASLGRSLTIGKGDQSISLNDFSETKFGNEPFSIESTSSAGLPVNLSSSDPTIASMSGNTVTIHAAGTVEIIAEQPGSDLYNAAQPIRKWLTIGKASQTISFDVLPEQTSDAGSLILSAAASSGLNILFESSDEEIVSIEGNVATIHKEGIVNITAHQPGDKNYLAAEDVARELVINIVLGVETFDLDQHLFPNPTSDVVYAELPALSNVEVCDAMGRTRPDIILQNGKIDFSSVASGVYFVKVSFRGQSIVKRIIKK
jgi:hypothetical protein